MSVPRVPLERALAQASGLFRTHGGSVELARVGDDGEVEVRFGGMCSGCPTKVLCLEHTVAPRVSAVPGVRRVVAPGARVSGEAAARVQTFLGDVDRPPVPLSGPESSASAGTG